MREKINIPYLQNHVFVNDFVPLRRPLLALRCPSSRDGATAPGRLFGSSDCRCVLLAPGFDDTLSGVVPPRLEQEDNNILKIFFLIEDCKFHRCQ